MRVLVVVSAMMMGCMGASTTPLSPEAPLAETEPATRNKVAPASEPAPDKASVPEAPSAAPIATTAPSTAPQAAIAGPPPKGASTVQLVSAGAEPRQQLRYVFHRGESVRWRLRASMTMDTVIHAADVSTMAPQTMHQLLPTTECTGTTVTHTVDADGTAHRKGSIDGFTVLPTPGVAPAVQSKVEEMLRSVGKIPYQDTIDTRGQIIDSQMDLSSIHDPTMLQSMQQVATSMSGFSVPWPLEAVGLGARWQVKGNYDMRQQLARTVAVTLTGLHGKQLQLEMVTDVTGTPRQDAKTGVSLGRTDAHSTAHLDVKLDPISSQSHSSTHTSTETVTNGVHLSMNIDTETDFQSGP
ncbi:MAG TPA: hypothetical protein VER11_12730 [Polyangiaceae bacterium]|nr:hypothetical protein [Polyangiaceae bacterium]